MDRLLVSELVSFVTLLVMPPFSKILHPISIIPKATAKLKVWS